MKWIISLLLVLSTLTANAQNITIVAGAGPGGITDMQARTVADFLNQKGYKTIVLNKSGANQTLASNYVANQVGDHKTLLLGSASNTAIRDAERNETDLIPIGYVGFTNFVFVVNKDQVKSRTLKDFFNEFIDNNQKINFASAGPLFNYALEDMLKHTNITPTIIMYKSNAHTLNDLTPGHIQAGFVDLGTSMELIKEGKLIPLAVISKNRSKHLPNVPTVNEIVKDFSALGGWFGLFSPMGVSEEHIKFYNNILFEMLQQPEYRERFENFYIQTQYMNLKEFTEFYKGQIIQFRKKLVKK